MRKEDLLADEDCTFAVPLQIEKIYNGERKKYSDDWKNMIIFGDNLQFLKTIYKNDDPVIKNKVKGKVKLIYIDPPFSTASDFENNMGQKTYSDKTKRFHHRAQKNVSYLERYMPCRKNYIIIL